MRNLRQIILAAKQGRSLINVVTEAERVCKLNFESTVEAKFHKQFVGQPLRFNDVWSNFRIRCTRFCPIHSITTPQENNTNNRCLGDCLATPLSLPRER